MSFICLAPNSWMADGTARRSLEYLQKTNIGIQNLMVESKVMHFSNSTLDSRLGGVADATNLNLFLYILGTDWNGGRIQFSTMCEMIF